MRQIIVNFFYPLSKKYRLWTISACIIIGILLYMLVDIGLAEVVRQNSYPIYTLSAELLRELGPEHVRASKDHVELIDQYYTKHLEQRYEQRRFLIALLRFLYPTYDTKKELESVLSGLEKAVKEQDDEKAKKAIRKSGLAFNQLYTLSKRFPRSPIQWFESEVVSDQLLSDVDDAFEKFHNRVDNLKNAQTLKAACDECRNACIDSRRALLLLSLTRLGYNKEEKIERLISDLKQARELAMDFAEKYKSEKKLFKDRADNIDLRAKIVEAILDKDMNRVCKILDEGIEEVFEKEKANLIP